MGFRFRTIYMSSNETPTKGHEMFIAILGTLAFMMLFTAILLWEEKQFTQTRGEEILRHLV